MTQPALFSTDLQTLKQLAPWGIIDKQSQQTDAQQPLELQHRETIVPSIG